MSVTRIGYLRPVGIQRRSIPPVVITQPDNTQWGPSLWHILHSFAERSGRHNKPLLDNEESRLWLRFIGHLRKALPCTICRQHFSEYLTSHPFDINVSKSGLEKQNALRTYFFTFHNAVNTRTSKIFTNPESDLSSMYGSYTVQQFAADKTVVINNMSRAIQLGHISRDDMVKAIRSLEELWLNFP